MLKTSPSASSAAHGLTQDPLRRLEVAGDHLDVRER